jgi:hypothetical protein
MTGELNPDRSNHTNRIVSYATMHFEAYCHFIRHLISKYELPIAIDNNIFI